MRGCKVRKLAVLIAVGALVAFVLKKLRGEPAPQFANHPTVRGGPLPDLVPAPDDPTVPASSEERLVPAPVDPTVPSPRDAAAGETMRAGDAKPATEPAPTGKAEPAGAAKVAETAKAAERAKPAEPAADGQRELDLPPLVAAPTDPTVPASSDATLVAEVADPTVPSAPGDPAAPAASTEDRTWVEPADGACPDGYPIKAKVKSGIYHQPGSVTYDRTKPDRCYPSVAAAEADGLRAPKR